MSGRGDWVLPAIIAVSVILVGVLGLTAWMVLSDDARTADPAAAQSTVTAVTTLRTRTVTATVTTPAAAPTQPTRTGATTTQAPSGAGGWYAQIGAFNDRSNADSAAAQQGAVVRPGYVVGSSSAWVVVIPTASEAEAESVCGRYGSSSCFVRYSAE